jgi:hypothetical protein
LKFPRFITFAATYTHFSSLSALATAKPPRRHFRKHQRQNCGRLLSLQYASLLPHHPSTQLVSIRLVSIRKFNPLSQKPRSKAFDRNIIAEDCTHETITATSVRILLHHSHHEQQLRLEHGISQEFDQTALVRRLSRLFHQLQGWNHVQGSPQCDRSSVSLLPKGYNFPLLCKFITSAHGPHGTQLKSNMG